MVFVHRPRLGQYILRLYLLVLRCEDCEQGITHHDEMLDYRLNNLSVEYGLLLEHAGSRRKMVDDIKHVPIGWIEQPTSPLRVARSTTELNGQLLPLATSITTRLRTNPTQGPGPRSSIL